jgi:hypothetical protein
MLVLQLKQGLLPVSQKKGLMDLDLRKHGIATTPSPEIRQKLHTARPVLTKKQAERHSSVSSCREKPH